MPIPEKIAQIIESSGNTFHAKVARWFQGQGWHIRVSPYYMDQSQNKAREIDLVAEKLWPVNGPWGDWYGYVVVRLFIECKFVPAHAVFWFTDKDKSAAEKLVCSRGVFRPDSMYTKRHHYISQCSRVAKVFASEASRGADLEPFYKALNQVLHAQVSMRDQPLSTPHLTPVGGELFLINYPIVVCHSFDKLYETDFYEDVPPAPVERNFQLEVQYAYVDRLGRPCDDYFLVDFIEFSRLPEFSAHIDVDAGAASHLFAPN